MVGHNPGPIDYILIVEWSWPRCCSHSRCFCSPSLLPWWHFSSYSRITRQSTVPGRRVHRSWSSAFKQPRLEPSRLQYLEHRVALLLIRRHSVPDTGRLSDSEAFGSWHCLCVDSDEKILRVLTCASQRPPVQEANWMSRDSGQALSSTLWNAVV